MKARRVTEAWTRRAVTAVGLHAAFLGDCDECETLEGWYAVADTAAGRAEIPQPLGDDSPLQLRATLSLQLHLLTKPLLLSQLPLLIFEAALPPVGLATFRATAAAAPPAVVEAAARRLEAAARTLGASRVRVFSTITLPLMAPGILVGAVLAFARALGEFGATITFVSNIPGETQTLPLALYSLAQTPDGESGALRLALIAIIVALIALILSEWLAKRVNRRRETHE